MLTNVLNRFRAQAEKLWQAETDANRARRIDELAEKLAGDEERELKAAKIEEYRARLGRPAFKAAVQRDIDAIAAIAVQIIPHWKAIEERYRKDMGEWQQVSAMISQLGGEAHESDAPSLNVAITMARHTIGQAFKREGEVERLRHLGELFDVSISSVQREDD